MKVSDSHVNQIPSGNLSQFAIEHHHRNSGFAQLQNGDSPVGYVNVYQMAIDSISMYIPLFFTEGILIFYW